MSTLTTLLYTLTHPHRGPTRGSVHTNSRTRGLSLVEVAVTIGILYSLIAIAIPVYLNGLNESFDTRARENVEIVVNQAETRLIRDRGDSFSLYGSSDTIADVLALDEPAVADKLVPLDPSDPAVDNPGQIGIGITPDGHLVVAALAETDRCWYVVVDPTRDGGGDEFHDQVGPCPGVALAAPNVDGNQFPIATDTTISLAPGDTVNFDLITDGYAFDPDAKPSPLTVTAVELPTDGTLTIDPNGPVEYTAPNTADLAVTFTYRADDGCTEADCGTFPKPSATQVAVGQAQATGTITFVTATPTAGAFTIGLNCGVDIDASTPGIQVPYGQNADCTATVVDSAAPDMTFTWDIISLDPAVAIDPYDCSSTDTSDPFSGTCRFTTNGATEAIVNVTGTDSLGEEATTAETIQFVNVAPTVSVTCDNNVSYADTSWCSVDAHDGNGDPLTYNWTVASGTAGVDVTSVCTSSPTCGVTVARTAPGNGVNPPWTADVDVTVDDGSGPVGPASTAINFINLAPTAPVVRCGEPVPYTQQMTCEVSGSSDPEGEPVTYSWELTPQGDDTVTPNNGTGTTITFDYDPNTAPLEPVTVVATADDGYGGTSSDNEQVTYLNEAPTIESVVCEDNPETYSEKVTCTATASDPEGETLTYQWTTPGSVGNEGCATAENNDDCRFTRPDPGTVEADVTVTDPYGASSSRIGTAVFINNPPAVNVTCDRTRTNKAGDPTVRCTATVSSPSPVGSLTFNWTDSDNQLGIDGCTAQQCTVVPTGTVGTFEPAVEVTDPYGETATGTGPGIEFFDAEPTVSSTGCNAVSNHAPATTSQTNCTITVRVSDADDATATVNWPGTLGTGVTRVCGATSTVTANGTATTSCSYRAEMGPATGFVSDTTRLVIVPITATTAGTTSDPDLANASFSNQPARILSGGTTSCSADNGDNCQFNIRAEDPEGGSVVYSWGNLSTGTGTLTNLIAGACYGTYT
ncbi:MAG: Ig-like domain-containing protein, partial [Maioricimonas sp. JB049]